MVLRAIATPSTVAPKIGYVVKRFPRLSETFIVNEVLALERQGLAVEIFSLKEPRQELGHQLVSALRAPVTYLPGRAALESWAFREGDGRQMGPERSLADLLPDAADEAVLAIKAVALATLARGRGITHLHAHFATGATTVARIASRVSGIPYSFTAHAKDIFHASVDHAALARKIRDARFVVTVSDYNLRYLKQRFGAGRAAKIARLYNGLDLERLAPDPAASPDPELVLAVGRLVEKKGFRHLVDACAVLRDRGVAFRCVVVGDGPEGAALTRQIDSLGLGRAVTLAGALPQERLLRIMRRAAVLALPCVVSEDGDRDGLPTVLLEALALGLPAISTSLPGIDEIIDHRRTGLLVPPADGLGLADGIAELLSNPDLRRHLAALGREKAEAAFDVSRNTRRLLDLFARSTASGRLRVIDEHTLSVR